MAEPTAHYTVLARRYRPQTFDDVVGQRNVAQALRNAIRIGRVAHAYLFTGARGVGKTSMARILAKALNCPNAVDGVPCNQCEICQGISAGSDVDINEIDGASNRGIDDIRALRANVNVKSMRTKYKMYIIDEVHMLSRDAFNALLKTLEEPPPNVKFVFCTTEPTKVPDTILSRCQRFDFATIETQNIIERLAEIAGSEGYNVEPGALELVARRAAGSMRDSQSLFDQLLAFGQEHITAADVHRLLGTASDDRLAAIVDALIDRQKDVVLSEFEAALSQGVQLGELVDQLLNYLRDLMVLSGGASSISLMSVAPESRESLAAQANRWGLHRIVAAMQILAETKTKMFRVPFARVLAELGLVRIALLEDLESLDGLIRQLESGTAPSPSSRPAAPPSSPPRAVSTPPPPAVKKNGAEQPSPAPQPTESAPQIQRVEFVPGNEKAIWSQVVSQIRDVLKDQVKGVQDVAIVGPNQLQLTFPRSYNFSKQFCERPDSLSRLQDLVSKVTGQSVRILLRLSEAVEEVAAETEPKKEPNLSTSRALQRIDDPFVEQAKTVFKASVIKVEPIASATRQE